MKLTADQVAANEALRAAVDQAVRAFEIFPDNAVTLDFVVSVEAASVDDEGDYDEEFFGLLFPGGNTRSVIAVGLLEKGKALLLDGERVEDDD